MQRRAIVLIAVILAKNNKRFGKTSAYMFLCEIYNPCVAAAEVS